MGDLDARQAVAGTPRLERLFAEVRRGLQGSPRRIPEKLFYDDRGARLFEEITRLDEYDPTRTEIGILREIGPELSDLVGPSARVVEFGTGEGTKTSILIDALERPALCVPIDIAESQLLVFAERLRMRHPSLEVAPLTADYSHLFHLPEAQGASEPGRTLFFFPGSTIGNFEPDEAARFLTRIGHIGGRGSGLLIGVDRPKARNVVEAAYDDADGVTAAFNLNALDHLNQALGGNFDRSGFRHRAVWNEAASRIEMHLVSRVAQRVTLAPDIADAEPYELDLAEGEAIVTEHSYKFEPSEFRGLCRSSGWRTVESWTDDREWFSVHLLEWDR